MIGLLDAMAVTVAVESAVGIVVVAAVSRSERAKAEREVEEYNRRCDEIEARILAPGSKIPVNRRSIPVRMEVRWP